jgi:folate-binding protein YgfZ
MSESTPNFTEVPTVESFKAPKPTPLAAFLMTKTPDLAVCAYEGILTPCFFDASSDKAGSELGDILTSAVALDLGWLARIAVKGEDRTRWLAGMTTNAVQALEEGHGNYNLVLNAQGRIQGDLYAFREQDRIVLETASAQVDRLVQHLDHFIIMDDVELERLTGVTAVGVVGAKALQVLEKFGIDVKQLIPMQQLTSIISGIPVTIVRAFSVLLPRFEIWVEEGRVSELWTALLDAGCKPAGLNALESLRVAEGIPAYGIDIQEKHLAQETSQTRALNFNKGCYLGQEIVERIRSRANIHRVLRQFELKGQIPTPGAELSADGKPVGHLSSVATLQIRGQNRTFAIGEIRTEALAALSDIQYDGGVAIPLETPPDLTPD